MGATSSNALKSRPSKPLSLRQNQSLPSAMNPDPFLHLGALKYGRIVLNDNVLFLIARNIH